MTSRLLISLTLLLLCPYGTADEPATESVHSNHPNEHHSEASDQGGAPEELTSDPGQRYLVTVAEFEVPGLAESPQMIHQMPELVFQKIKEDDLHPREVVRLTALSNVASHVQHSKRVKRTVTMTSSGQGRGPQQVQSQSDLDIGSLLEIKITADKRHSIAEIRFESARIVGGDDASESHISSTNIETTVQVNDGQPVLLGSTSEDTPRFFVLMIRAL